MDKTKASSAPGCDQNSDASQNGPGRRSLDSPGHLFRPCLKSRCHRLIFEETLMGMEGTLRRFSLLVPGACQETTKGIMVQPDALFLHMHTSSGGERAERKLEPGWLANRGKETGPGSDLVLLPSTFFSRKKGRFPPVIRSNKTSVLISDVLPPHAPSPLPFRPVFRPFPFPQPAVPHILLWQPMIQIPLDKAYLTAIWLETLLYGAFI